MSFFYVKSQGPASHLLPLAIKTIAQRRQYMYSLIRTMFTANRKNYKLIASIKLKHQKSEVGIQNLKSKIKNPGFFSKNPQT